MPPPPLEHNAVFLNIPYDEEFKSLYVAYVVGLSLLGLVPHIASEIPGGARRLDRILALIQRCRYSIHDLSRVEVSVVSDSVPRFNMPLELGMTITWSELYPDLHTWFVWESEPYRIQRSASDLNGTDPCIHHGTVEGVLSELRSAFWRQDAPQIDEMVDCSRFVQQRLDLGILAKTGGSNPYSKGVFEELRRLSSRLAWILQQTRTRPS
ncbi:MAG: hypothetical protein WCE75_00830 [Terracidiphilus sp.]